MTRSLIVGVLLGALAVPAMAQETVPPGGTTGGTTSPRPSPTRPTVPPDAGPIGPIDGGTGSRREGSGAGSGSGTTSPTGDRDKTSPTRKRDPNTPNAPKTTPRGYNDMRSK